MLASPCGVARGLLFLVVGLEQGLAAPLCLRVTGDGDACCLAAPSRRRRRWRVLWALGWGFAAPALQCEIQRLPSWGKPSVNRPPRGVLRVPMAFRGSSAPGGAVGAGGSPPRFWERIGGNFQTGCLGPCPNRAPGTARGSRESPEVSPPK